MSLLYHAYVYLEFLILACTIYILAPLSSSYLSQFFQEGNSENLTEKQKEVLRIWNNLSTNEQETVMSMLRGLRK